MNEHLQELKLGGRPKRKWEIEIEEKDKEIERLKRKYDMQVNKEAIEEIKHTIDLDKEIERLNNIIKEVREYANSLMIFENIKEVLLNIVDKENK